MALQQHFFFFTYHYSRMSLPGIRNESTSALILKGHYTSTEDAAEYWHKGESSKAAVAKNAVENNYQSENNEL